MIRSSRYLLNLSVIMFPILMKHPYETGVQGLVFK